MDMVTGFFEYLWAVRTEMALLTVQHLLLSTVAIFCGAMIAIPGGIFISRYPSLGMPLLDVTGILYTIPSLALLGFLIPFLGLGIITTVVALTLYSLLPLLRNTYVGIKEVDVFIKEAAIGMGSTRNQLLWKVELPLALPFIMAGLRTVTVMTVGITTLGALVGAGGLGVLIFRGMHMLDSNMLLAGTLPVAAMAIIFDNLLAFAEQKIRQFMGILDTNK